MVVSEVSSCPSHEGTCALQSELQNKEQGDPCSLCCCLSHLDDLQHAVPDSFCFFIYNRQETITLLVYVCHKTLEGLIEKWREGFMSLRGEQYTYNAADLSFPSCSLPGVWLLLSARIYPFSYWGLIKLLHFLSQLALKEQHQISFG